MSSLINIYSVNFGIEHKLHMPCTKIEVDYNSENTITRREREREKEREREREKERESIKLVIWWKKDSTTIILRYVFVLIVTETRSQKFWSPMSMRCQLKYMFFVGLEPRPVGERIVVWGKTKEKIY